MQSLGGSFPGGSSKAVDECNACCSIRLHIVDVGLLCQPLVEFYYHVCWSLLELELDIVDNDLQFLP